MWHTVMYVHCVVFRMHRRVPSVRHPRRFYDIFGVIVVGVLTMISILSVWHGTIIRVEMAVFGGLLFLWAAWAIYRILAQYPGKTTLSRVK